MPRHLPARHTVQLPPSFCPHAEISANGIRIGATEIPTQWISDYSIVVEPGGGKTPNRIHLTLIVGDVDIDDNADDVRTTSPL
jgi:hypothetical protein